jgi:hypothetical protein
MKIRTSPQSIDLSKYPFQLPLPRCHQLVELLLGFGQPPPHLVQALLERLPLLVEAGQERCWA